MDRRQFLKGGVHLGLLPWIGAAQASNDPTRVLTAQPGVAQLADGAESVTRIWGYDGRVPGPTLRVRQNEWVHARLVNRLTTETSVHWHGVRIDNAMDGVAGLTQDAVAPDESFDYRFRLPDAGTFWYHAHSRSWEQVARGLYGLLIVDEAEPVAVDRDLTFVIDDWRLDDEAQIHEASFGSLHDWAHGGRLGQWVTINGRPFERFEVRRGQRLRLRVVNTANARVFTLDFADLAPRVIALDGQPVAPQRLEGHLQIAPAQRVDLLIDVTQDAGAVLPVAAVTRSDMLPVAQFEVAREETGAVVFEPFVGLAANPLATGLELDAAERAVLVMEGGAMGGMASAMLDGQQLSLRELAQRGAVWAFNGSVGMTDEPLVSTRRGRTVVIDVHNRNRWPHAMHLHGHHFRVVTRDGVAQAATTPWRDTELLQAGESVGLAFVADNPGKWLLHCHMLEHQAAGMKTWFEVT